MVLVLLPLTATCCFAIAIVGWRLSRSTGVGAAAAMLEVIEEQSEPMVIRVIDSLGIALQRLLLAAYGPRRRARLDERLARAGRPEGLTERAFLRRQAGYTMIGVLVLLPLWIVGQLLIGLVVLVLCSVWMHVWLYSVGRRRQREIARGLPDFLDVVAVTVSAGLNLQAALERVSSSDESALGEEIRTTLNDLRYGLSRRAALERLRDRNEVPSLGSFVTALLQAEELGIPLAKALIDIASEVRRERAQQARQEAAKAGSKASLVVSMTIVPGAMILIISSMVLANLPTFRDLFG
jgi:pilus assembly protein TadC